MAHGDECCATAVAVARLFLVPFATLYLMATLCYGHCCSCCVHDAPPVEPQGRPKVRLMKLAPRVAAKPLKRDPRLREFDDEPFHGVCFDTPCARRSVAALTFGTLFFMPPAILYLVLAVSQLPIHAVPSNNTPVVVETG